MAEQLTAHIAIVTVGVLHTNASIQLTLSLGCARGSYATIMQIAIREADPHSTLNVMLFMGLHRVPAGTYMTQSMGHAREKAGTGKRFLLPCDAGSVQKGVVTTPRFILQA